MSAEHRVCREKIEWCDVWVSGADSGKRPRLLLIGDSITRAYYPKVAEQLSAEFACARLASSKCVGDPAFFKELDLVFSEYKFDIVHFNNGMHGWSYSEKEYGAGLAAVIDVLLSKVPGGSMIWGATTPVRTGAKFEMLDEEKTQRVRERNAIASELAGERGMQINDLFDLVIGHPEYYADSVHFNAAGNSVLGLQVAASVRNVKVDRPCA